MKVIIIGSNGFIGQHLYNYYVEKGYAVWGADVVSDFVNHERYFFINASDPDYNFVFQQEKYDICVNCSGAANVPESLINPFQDFFLNTVIVFKILEAIRQYQPLCRFVNLSSAAVYGNPRLIPVKEDAVTNPLSPYGIHKLQAEHICREFHSFYKIKTCTVRIFSVYGPGLKKQLFWDLYRKTKSTIPFTLFGTGNESRDFIYILDLVKAIDLVTEHASFNADVINIANGKEIKIKEAVLVFLKFFDHDIKYLFSGETREGDPLNWLADISILNTFGYQPSYTIESGLKQYYEWVTHYKPN